MRKFFIPLLMASAMVPAAAMAQDRSFGGRAWHNQDAQQQRDDNRAAREERQEQRRANSNNNSNSNWSTQQAAPVMRQRPVQQQVEVAPQPRDFNRDRMNAERQINRDRMNADRQFERRNEQQIERRTDVRRDRWVARPRPVEQVQQQAPVAQPPRVVTQRPRSIIDQMRWIGQNPDKGFTHGERRWANHDGSWSRDWRRDHNFDWYRYRNANRYIFRLNSYYDPYGYNYRRFSIGFNLWPSYYGQNYWIDDPWMYRLPEVWGPYRWVRYYDDALLVDIYSGEVVDVIYDFFW